MGQCKKQKTRLKTQNKVYCKELNKTNSCQGTSKKKKTPTLLTLTLTNNS